MPVISMFYGIIVQMFVLDTDRHHEPHIHARYAEHTASIAIATGTVLAGSLPTRQLRLVEAWIEIHREELDADWTLAASGTQPYKIEPLR
jgi:hypothetical protein